MNCVNGIKSMLAQESEIPKEPQFLLHYFYKLIHMFTSYR